jgi:Homeodomain-like domain
MARAIDWARYDQLTAQGHSEQEIAGALDIPRTTFWRQRQRRQQEVRCR